MPASQLSITRHLWGALLLSAGVLYLGYGVDRQQFWSLFGAFVVAFGGYLALVYRAEARYLKPLIGLGILLRVALVFAFPLLSDDVYRFIWDGNLIVAGENPFAHLPAYYLEAGNQIPGLTPELFARLNSPDYYTIYPPIAQGVFTASAWLSPGSWYGAAVVMKLFLLLCELGSLWVMWRLLGAGPQVQWQVEKSKDQRPRLLYYWLNPLILVEITGNLHFEGAMVFFLLLAYYLLQRSKLVAGAVAMAASVASKLLPLMLLPFLIRRLIKGSPFKIRSVVESYQYLRRFLLFSLTFGITCLLFFLPFLLSPDFLEGFQSSLELYQRKFEFNASLYYLARAYGYFDVGWNQIAVFGPMLAKASAVGILLMALLDRRSDWPSLAAGWLFAFVLYLLCATTVHPWYLSVPIALSVFTRWRFPLVWSFLIMLTYTNYLTVPYEENLWLVGTEYLLVLGFALWEWRRVPTASAVG
ncbi:glycosyltransferase 87 family protein [Neolewinella agarilytica]|uniref:glycosyltransferase 87 family protein n=1 Tax=Neolewinella agarilytica TaxID=478744 RepID=UPI0023543DEA|nr:glycosyltransferase 87 family protein [Neolewinella agarilytica]